MGAPGREARSSPTAIGFPPFRRTASALPPAASIRSQTQSQARSISAGSPSPVDTEGILSQSSSSSRKVAIGAPFCRK